MLYISSIYLTCLSVRPSIDSYHLFFIVWPFSALCPEILAGPFLWHDYRLNTFLVSGWSSPTAPRIIKLSFLLADFWYTTKTKISGKLFTYADANKYYINILCLLHNKHSFSFVSPPRSIASTIHTTFTPPLSSYIGSSSVLIHQFPHTLHHFLAVASLLPSSPNLSI
ncbi:hypothetical protein DSUL_60111 [Desulfovibrionales bacterium]